MRLFCLEKLPPELQAAVTYRYLRVNEVLYRQGDMSKAVFCVLQGRMRLDNHVPSQGTVPLYVIRPGECVSEAALFAERYCSDAVAEITSLVSIFPNLLLQAALEKDPELAREFMTLQSRRFNVIRRSMEIRSIRPAKERVLQYLLSSKPANSSRLWLDRPLKRIAEDIGLTHEAFYRTMRELERENTIRWRENTLIFPQEHANCNERYNVPETNMEFN